VPRFADPAVEKRLRAKSFSQGYMTTQLLFGILTVMSLVTFGFADSEPKQLRVMILIIGFVTIMTARYLHTEAMFSDQARAACSWQTIAAVVTATTIPLSRLACPYHTMPPTLIAGIHLVAIAVTRLYHFTPASRLLIHVGIFVANLENSHVLTASALLGGEVVGTIFEHDSRAAFLSFHTEVQRLKSTEVQRLQGGGGSGRSEDEDKMLIKEQERLLEALRESNERREIEICMMRREGWQPSCVEASVIKSQSLPGDDGTAVSTDAKKVRPSDCLSESDMPLGAEASYLWPRTVAETSAPMTQQQHGVSTAIGVVSMTSHNLNHQLATDSSTVSSLEALSHHTAKLPAAQGTAACLGQQQPGSTSSDSHFVTTHSWTRHHRSRWAKASSLLRNRRPSMSSHLPQP